MSLFTPKSYTTELSPKSIREVEKQADEAKEEIQTIQAEPFSGNTPGLVPESNDDTQAKFLRGDGSWANPPGGGGGTSNYEDLANKPAIDGTTLDKNTTAEGLGLAKTEDIPDLTDYAKKTDIPDVSDFVEEEDLADYAKKSDIPTVPTKTSQLTNDSGFITGNDIPSIPSKTSQLTNDAGFISQESDPTVPSWAKQQNPPTPATFDGEHAGLVPAPASGDAGKFLKSDGTWGTPSGGDAGFTPIGTIIAVFGETAPANYLICDGTAYNKADYPELAAHLLALTDPTPYEVDGDNTKFKVPDLRGEFLRGTGTNGHTNNGDGANVGIHQDATYMPLMYDATQTAGFNSFYITSVPSINGDGNNRDLITNLDKYRSARTYGDSYRTRTKITGTFNPESGDASSIDYSSLYSVRPTNTSVLFCIATKNIYLNPSNDYSTDEKVVGTWIDGKTLYQKTIVDTMPTDITAGTPKDKYISLGVNIDVGFIVNSAIYMESGAFFPLNYTQDTSGNHFVIYGNILGSSHSTYPNTLRINCSHALSSGRPVVVTIQYTKTS